MGRNGSSFSKTGPAVNMVIVIENDFPDLYFNYRLTCTAPFPFLLYITFANKNESTEQIFYCTPFTHK